MSTRLRVFTPALVFSAAFLGSLPSFAIDLNPLDAGKAVVKEGGKIVKGAGNAAKAVGRDVGEVATFGCSTGTGLCKPFGTATAPSRDPPGTYIGTMTPGPLKVAPVRGPGAMWNNTTAIKNSPKVSNYGEPIRTTGKVTFNPNDRSTWPIKTTGQTTVTAAAPPPRAAPPPSDGDGHAKRR